MKTGASVSILAVLASLTSLALAQGEAPPAPEPPAGAAAPAAAPAAAAPPPAAAPAPAPMGAPAPAPAPTEGGARTHDGFFFRLGLNFGPLIMNEKLEAGSVSGGEADYSGLHTGFDLMFGGSPMPGLAIGGALIAGWTKNPKVDLGTAAVEPKGTLIFTGLGVFGDYYLDPHKGLHFQGMLGFSAVDFVPEEGSNSGDSPSGMMFGAGVGYDFWIGDEWSIGPFGRVLYSSMSAENGGVKDKVSYLYPSIGVAFTLH